jgi:hypothetical protein
MEATIALTVAHYLTINGARRRGACSERHSDSYVCPLEPVWVGVGVLARKIADIDPTKFIWSASVEACLGGDSHYPPPVRPVHELRATALGRLLQ